MDTVNNERRILQDMSEDECTKALAGEAFGRLAINDEDGPMIFPVNYVFVENAIVIRTAAGSKLVNAPLTRVAFEIDYVHPTRVHGWSVIARGQAFDVSTAIDELSEEMRLLPFYSWLGGDKPFVMKINIRELTGRMFSPQPRSEDKKE